MPWEERRVMTEREQFCETVVRAGATVSACCRQFGISRKTGYKWLRRYRANDKEAMSDRSRRPHRSPGRITATVEARIVALKHQYPYWGPRKLRRLLLAEVRWGVSVTVSGVARVLARHGLVIPVAPSTPVVVQRFERREPNDLWQMDLKAAWRLSDGRKVYPVGILDDYSRYLLGLWLIPNQSDESVLHCWIAAVQRHGLPRQTLTDHGAQFGMNSQDSSAFRTYLTACGVQHLQGRVNHPQTQGKIERVWRTLRCELLNRLDTLSPDTWPLALETWRQQYNDLRPHESLGDEPPASRYHASTRPYVPPDRWAPVGHPDSLYRRVNSRGWISLGRYRWMVGRGYAGWTVEARSLGTRCWHIYFRNHFICEIIPEPTPVTRSTRKEKSVTYVPVQL